MSSRIFHHGIRQGAFPEELREGISDISVRVRMLNINKGRNQALMEACRPLAEYATLIFCGYVQMNHGRLKLLMPNKNEICTMFIPSSSY